MGDLVPFKTKEPIPTAKQVELFRARSNLSEYFSSKPGVVSVALLIRDCFKYLLSVRKDDKMLGKQINVLYETTAIEVRNGDEQI